MVNTRAKFRKTQNILKTCFPQTSITDSDQESTESGSLIGSNDELLTKILHRLPVTSILQFKSVSKHWLSLLSRRSFTLLIDKRSITPGLFVREFYIPFDVENQTTPPFRSLDFYPDVGGIRIVQSCNGLLLCCSDKGKSRRRKYYVFNPTTKQFAVIPSVLGGRDVRERIRFMGKWKILNHSDKNYYTQFSNGVYWNGAIHWALLYHQATLYFKLDVQQLQTLQLPMKVASTGRYYRDHLPLYFGESQGHLHLVKTANHDNDLQLNVYEMLSDHSGWFVKYKVDLDELPVAFPEMIYNNRPPWVGHGYEFEVLDVVRGENEEDSFMIVRVPKKMIKYNILNKSFKQIFGLSNTSYVGIGNVHRYIETLASF